MMCEKQVLIYAGTTEGRVLAETLAKSGVRCTVSVATEYGEEVMPRLAGITVEVGRKNVEEMIAITRQGGYCAVVDATHPFATEVSTNIKESTLQTGVPYLRLQRNVKMEVDETGQGECVYADAKACAVALQETEGNIFLTTGSKELPAFCQSENLKKRLVVRILPAEENLRSCKEMGLTGKQILAMQGPFSQELNEAIMRQYKIRHLVTKESGRTGGVDEKLKAAHNCGASVWLIGNPERERGLNFRQVLDQIGSLCNTELTCEAYETCETCETAGTYGAYKTEFSEENELDSIQNSKDQMKISLVGVGMGNEATLTLQAKAAIEKADYLFGAQRVIEPFEAKIKSQALYMPKDVILSLESIKTKDKITYVSILFSGDTGFASGCTKMYQELQQAGYKNLEVIPGISTIAYLSAKAGIPWQKAELFSIHGKGGPLEWQAELLWKVRYHAHTFLLVSGVKDIQQIGKLLSDKKLECEMFVGYHMSYPDEQYYRIEPQEAWMLTTEGLYGCVITNHCPEKLPLTRHILDEQFLRDKVPMTKAEVRTLSIAKLRLEEGAVVYDIGSGTGSVAIEIAQHSPTIQVYAIEQNAEAVALIQKNAKLFGADNIKVVEGMAPEVLKALPEPTHVFVGGSKGNLKKIINTIKEIRNPVNVVINAVSLETIKEITEISQEYPEAELVQLAVTRSKQIGSYHMMQSENPVMLCFFTIR